MDGKIIGFLAIPIWVLISPWMELLGTLGMVEGEWIRAPSFLGYFSHFFLCSNFTRNPFWGCTTNKKMKII